VVVVEVELHILDLILHQQPLTVQLVILHLHQVFLVLKIN